MRFAFVFDEGYMTAWMTRLVAEGHEVMAFCAEPDNRQIGDGLVKKANSLLQLEAWANEKPGSVFVFEFTNHGEWADNLRRRGKLVLGASKARNRFEEDREWAGKVFKMLGLRLPPSIAFSSISDAISKATKLPDGNQWYFKSNKFLEGAATFGSQSSEELVRMLSYYKTRFGDGVSGILQQKVMGPVVSTSWWWSGTGIVEPLFGMLEFKKFLAGNNGPNTGAEISWVWAYSSRPKLWKELKLDDVSELLRRLDVGPGEFDINSVISERDGHAYAIEPGPRFGYDEDAIYLAGIPALGDALVSLATGGLKQFPLSQAELYLGVRLTVPPYPWEHVDADPKECALDVPVGGIDDLTGHTFAPYGLKEDDDGLLLGDPSGKVGVAISVGNSLSQMADQLYNQIREYEIPNLQFRVDANMPDVAKWFKTMKHYGYETPKWSE